MTTPERETAITITLRHYSHKELADVIEAALLAAKAEEREACAVELEEWAEATNVIRDKFKAAEQKFAYLTGASAVRARGAPAAVKEEPLR